jgi:hypothetical protein
MKTAARLVLWFHALCCAACAAEPAESGSSRREFMAFQREVYPVLLRDCGFPECHGAPERFFRVWGPGRVRLPGETSIPSAFDLPTGDELSATYALALSMIDAQDPARSLLLRKPLAVEAGGAGHLGVDKYGRNIYRTTQDAGYLVLARWVMSPPPSPPPGPTP